jgi:hypothetical protein
MTAVLLNALVPVFVGLLLGISAVPGGFFGMVFGKSFDATSETASSGLIALCMAYASAMDADDGEILLRFYD